MDGQHIKPGDPTFDQLGSAGADGDDRRAALHEAGHVLALVSRGIKVNGVAIWDSGYQMTHGRWEGVTYPGDYDIPARDEMSLALAGIAAEKAVSAAATSDDDEARRILEWIPNANESDFVDAAKVAWKDLYPGEERSADFAADPAVVEAIVSLWPEVVAEMTGLVEAITSFAEGLLATDPRVALFGHEATAFASQLIAPQAG